LSLGNNLPQKVLEVFDIVVLEHADAGPRETNTITNRSVIEFVRNDEAALAHERWDRSRVGSETHRRDERIFVTKEAGNESFRLDVQIECSAFQSGSTGVDTIPPDSVLDCIGTTTPGLGKPEVIIGRNVESTSMGTGEFESVVVVFSATVEQDNGTSGDTGHGAGEAVVQTGLETAGIERIKIRVQRGITLTGTN
jgi:hypothetical protein